MKKLLLYDSLFFYSKGLQSILNTIFPELEVTVVNNQKIALELSQKQLFDILILDVVNNNSHDFKVLKKIKSLQTKSKLFVLSFDHSSSFKLQCSKCGVDFLLLKSCSEAYFIAALKLALYGNTHFKNKVKLNIPSSKKNQTLLASSAIINKLSSREYEIALMMVRGDTNTTISRDMNLATSTVSTYKKRLLEKTKTANIIEFSKLFNQI
jgi:DNA-binding NarL/FixJ family response regulator